MQISLYTLATCNREDFDVILRLCGKRAIAFFAGGQFNEANLLLAQISEKKIDEPEMIEKLQGQLKYSRTVLDRLPGDKRRNVIRTKAGIKRMLNNANG